MSKFFDFLVQESIEDKGIFKACFMAGTPGSGKTYTISKIKSGQIEPRIVNTDTWTEWFKAYSDDEWEKMVNKIKTLTKNQLAGYLNSLLPLWVDGTSSSPPAVFRRVGILKSMGYDVSMIWVTTDLETSLARNAQRERKVDPEFIKGVYNRIQELKPYYQSEFKTFTEINTNEGALTDKVVLKAYNKMSSWFLSPIENPIGRSLYDKMRSNKWKYLIDVPEYDMNSIKKLVDGWYRK